MRLWVPVLFGQTKIDHIDLVASLTDAHEEVVWLDVSVDEVTRVNVFNARNLRGNKNSISFRNHTHCILCLAVKASHET
jgi:hypothetical protein